MGVFTITPISIFNVFMSNVLHGIFLILTNCCPRTEDLELRNFHDRKSVAS